MYLVYIKILHQTPKLTLDILFQGKMDAQYGSHTKQKCGYFHYNFFSIQAIYLIPLCSPFNCPIQEVEEGLKHHMVACLVWVVKFGRVQGNGGPRRVPYTLE